MYTHCYHCQVGPDIVGDLLCLLRNVFTMFTLWSMQAHLFWVILTNISAIKEVDTEMLKAIKKLKLGCSWVQILCLVLLLRTALILFAPSLKHAYHPRSDLSSLWRKFTVVPVKEAGDMSRVDNYGPISLLYACLKVWDSYTDMGLFTRYNRHHGTQFFF